MPLQGGGDGGGASMGAAPVVVGGELLESNPRVLGAAGAEAGCGMLLFHQGMLAAVLLCQREPGTTAPGPQ